MSLFAFWLRSRQTWSPVSLHCPQISSLIPPLIYTEAETQTTVVAVRVAVAEIAIAVNSADIIRVAQVRGARPPTVGRASFIVTGSIRC